ncbi:MAG: ROK family protein [Gammaproteobacteria bacterium]
MRDDDDFVTDQQYAVSASPRVLVVDVGGTHVKILATGEQEHRYFDSGSTMTSARMVAGVHKASHGWKFDVIAMGYPGRVVRGRPIAEPHNLANGWVVFNYEAAFGHPIRIINDAAMQALGSYKGGRMLFLGLGTGLGSAMVVNGELAPMELGHLPYRKGRTYEDYVGERGLKRLGSKRWRRHVDAVVKQLRAALEPDDVVLGGGNIHKLDRLPPKARRGDNDNAFLGGFRLWENGETWAKKKVAHER